MHESRRHVPPTPAIVVAALGVVFGDIGTSPIYTFAAVFNPADPHPVPLTPADVYGVVSLVFWAVLVIVTITYVLLAMRADNDGEGGLLALITQLRRWGDGRRKVTAGLVALGIFGAALFFGDSMITPAISVLAAVEGMGVVEPSLERLVLPVTVVIILGLFAVQRRGTASVGRLFGPVMVVWFVSIGAFGLRGIVAHPAILRALSPSYAVAFLASHLHVAFFSLAGVVLAVTGAEALYADLGHFGRRVITRAWLFLVFPACLLSYFGQGAVVLAANRPVAPFFLLAPGWARVPLVVLATAATVIASQAVITGTYSVVAQAGQLGYLPRLRILHTSESRIGQIYVPLVNGVLLAAVLTLVFTFRHSTALAFAYGMAVTGTITITTLLFFAVARVRWHTPRTLLVLGAIPLLTVDLLFFAANLTKLPHGAWVPLLVGLLAFTVMVTWQRGHAIVLAQRHRREGSLREFVERLRAATPPVGIVDGTAIYLNRSRRTAPLALHSNIAHHHVRHAHLLIVTVGTEPVPRVRAAERVAVDDLGPTDDGIAHVTVRVGYHERLDLPAVLGTLDPVLTGGPQELAEASYFVSRVDLRSGPARTMARWRKKLFILTSRASQEEAEHYRLPLDQTVTVGSRIDV